jgi:Ferritin-like domain
MRGPDHAQPPIRWTRGRLLGAALAGGAAAAGGAALAGRGGAELSAAAPSRDMDAEILNLFLLLEYVQLDFYRQAAEAGSLDGELARFASTVGTQEREHVGFLAKRLGDRARARPNTDFDERMIAPDGFPDAAIELEEATIAAYVGQAGNLTRGLIGAAAILLSVEARQAAWMRSIAGISPAPRAADPARKPNDVIAELRNKGYIA